MNNRILITAIHKKTGECFTTPLLPAFEMNDCMKKTALRFTDTLDFGTPLFVLRSIPYHQSGLAEWAAGNDVVEWYV